jgi:hypothetical protein
MQNLIEKLAKAYPELEIKAGNRFQFTPPNQLFYATDTEYSDTEAQLLLLHELGHYLIGETDYHTDIELLEIEAKAWAKAHDLCKEYGLEYNEDFAEDRLDSYRNYLHFTSLCKNCQLAGYQDDRGNYHCPLCNSIWKHEKIPH